MKHKLTEQITMIKTRTKVRAQSHNMSFSEGNVGQVNSYSYNKFFTIKLKLMENSINSSENFTESSKPEPEF